MRAMRIRTALVAVILLTPLLFTACGEGQGAEPTPTPTATSTAAVKPIPWEFPLWSEVLSDIEECIPNDGVTIPDIQQSGSRMWIKIEALRAENMYDFVSCLEESGNFSEVNMMQILNIAGDKPRSTVHLDIGMKYTLYVDGANIWHYPVYHPASSYIFAPGSIAMAVANDAGMENAKTVQNTSTMTVDGFFYSVESYKITALADEGLLQIIESFDLLEERGQREWPIISLNMTANQSVEEMTANQSVTSCLWKIDDLRLRGLSRLEFKLLFLFR